MRFIVITRNGLKKSRLNYITTLAVVQIIEVNNFERAKEILSIYIFYMGRELLLFQLVT